MPTAKEPPTTQPAVGVFDLKTTGINADTDRIATAYVGVVDEHRNVISGQQ